MALSCLLSRIAAPHHILRGQTLRTTKSIMIRSSAILSNKDQTQFLISEKIKKELFQKKEQFALLPSALINKVRYASSSAPEPEYKKHDHVRLWQLEKVLTVALLGTIPSALLMPSVYLDTALALFLVLHTHWGLEAIIIDYIRPIIFGNVIPKVSLGLLYVFSAVLLAGLFNLIYNDFGLANTVIHIWKS